MDGFIYSAVTQAERLSIGAPVGGRMDRSLAQQGTLNGRPYYVMESFSVYWTPSGKWKYTHLYHGDLASSTQDAPFPWLASWTDGFTSVATYPGDRRTLVIGTVLFLSSLPTSTSVTLSFLFTPLTASMRFFGTINTVQATNWVALAHPLSWKE